MKGFHLYNISSLTSVQSNCIEHIYEDLVGLVLSKEVTWVRFPTRISAFYSIFSIFSINIYICAINFLPEYQIRKYVQLCCINSAIFSFFFFFFSFFKLIWPFQEKSHFRLCLQSCK